MIPFFAGYTAFEGERSIVCLNRLERLSERGAEGDRTRTGGRVQQHDTDGVDTLDTCIAQKVVPSSFN